MSFVVDSFYELLALQRVMLEGKFSDSPYDNDVYGSPFVAEMHIRVIEEIKSSLIQQNKSEEAKSWDQWRRSKAKEGTREWEIGLRNVSEGLKARKWTETEKIEWVKTVFCPFILSDEEIRRVLFLLEK